MVLRYPSYINALRMKSGRLHAGDRLLLMSDAIACWYLRCWMEDVSVRDDFNYALTNQNKVVLKRIIASERENKQLRNDDVAIMCIDIIAI